jgi:hypothetical protein
MTGTGFPHSDILGSRFACQLPEAYRRLPRPSSAPGAKASTLCPYKLDHKDYFKDARVHCAVLNQRPGSTPSPAPTPAPEQQLEHQERFIRTRAVRRPTSHPGSQARQAISATPRHNLDGCSLRTQQRAKPTPATGEHPFPPHRQAAGVLGATDHPGRP